MTIDDKLNRKRQSKAGTTLVELLVCLLLMGIMLTIVGGMIPVAYRILRETQKRQQADMIIDNVVATLQNEALEATGFVKIYGEKDPGAAYHSLVGEAGAERGDALEFLNKDGYVVVVTASGSPQLKRVMGDPTKEGTTPSLSLQTADPVAPGYLVSQYYWRDQKDTGSTGKYTYTYQLSAGNPVARDVAKAFGDGYYMGNHVKVTFYYPAGETSPYTYINARVELYEDDEMTSDLIALRDTSLDLRGALTRQDEVTAKDASVQEPDPGENPGGGSGGESGGEPGGEPGDDPGRDPGGEGGSETPEPPLPDTDLVRYVYGIDPAGHTIQEFMEQNAYGHVYYGGTVVIDTDGTRYVCADYGPHLPHQKQTTFQQILEDNNSTHLFIKIDNDVEWLPDSELRQGLACKRGTILHYDGKFWIALADLDYKDFDPVVADELHRRWAEIK